MRPFSSRLSSWLLVLLVLGLAFLAACAPSLNSELRSANAHGVIAGFWLGLWHGLIAPVTFVVSLFSKRVNVYEIHNNGGWYNLGFLLGLSCVFGGGGHQSHAAWRRR